MLSSIRAQGGSSLNLHPYRGIANGNSCRFVSHSPSLHKTQENILFHRKCFLRSPQLVDGSTPRNGQAGSFCIKSRFLGHISTRLPNVHTFVEVASLVLKKNHICSSGNSICWFHRVDCTDFYETEKIDFKQNCIIPRN